MQARCGAKLRFHHNMGGLPDKRVIILRLGNARANNATATSHGHRSGRHRRQNLLVIVGLALRLNELDDLVDLIVRDKAPLDTAGLAPVDLGEQHVAQTGELFGAHLVDNDAGIDARSHVKGNTVGDVGLNKASHHVRAGALRSHDKVNTGGTAQLRDTDDRGLDILAGDHHQVRKLVDDDDQIGHLLRRVIVVFKLAGCLLFVIRRDLANVEALEDLQATLHLGHGPLQRTGRLLGLGHHGHVEMRQAVIARKLDALGVDHDQANVLGKGAHEQGRDDGVDHDRLTRTGGAGDQQVGHLSEVGDNRRALGIATDGKLERTALHIGKYVAQIDVLTLAIGNLDTHERGAGNRREDAHRLGGKRKRDIVLEARDLAHALALTGLQLKGRDRGAGNPADNAGATAKLKQGGLQRLGSLFQLLIRRRGGRRLRIGVQDFERREFEAVLLFALGIGNGTVRSPITGCNRSS